MSGVGLPDLAVVAGVAIVERSSTSAETFEETLDWFLRLVRDEARRELRARATEPERTSALAAAAEGYAERLRAEHAAELRPRGGA